MRAAILLGLMACTPEEDFAFGVVGEVADQFERGSTIGLWTVTTPSEYTFKFGSGSASPTLFGLDFRTEPPAAAVDGAGIGVALIGNLPGISTIPDGEVDLAELRLIGMSTDTAVIFKTPGAVGTSWSNKFPDGFSCGRCIRVTDLPDRFEPIDCTFLVIERAFEDRCVWY